MMYIPFLILGLMIIYLAFGKRIYTWLDLLFNPPQSHELKGLAEFNVSKHWEKFLAEIRRNYARAMKQKDLQAHFYIETKYTCHSNTVAALVTRRAQAWLAEHELKGKVNYSPVIKATVPVISNYEIVMELAINQGQQ